MMNDEARLTSKRRHEACIGNASDLLVAAKTVREAIGLEAIAFHLAVLSLEEIGKACILKIQQAQSIAEVAPISSKGLDDHTKKLFWALWGPLISKSKPVKDEIDDLRGLAKLLHAKRLATMYVDHSAKGEFEAIPEISTSELDSLFGLVEARLAMERDYCEVEAGGSDEDLMIWFLRVCEHEESRAWVMRDASAAMLHELGDYKKWVEWLRREHDARLAESARLARAELDRPATDSRKDKWEVCIRVQSASHSIRSTFLKEWNKKESWIRFAAVGKSRETFDIIFILPEAAKAGVLWDAVLDLSHTFLISLSVGSFGFFWWSSPERLDQFYEKIVDLESGAEVRIRANPMLKVSWGNRVLETQDLGRALDVFNFLMKERQNECPYIRHYIKGCNLLAKNDVLFRVETDAFLQFYFCVRELLGFGTGVTPEQCEQEYRSFLDSVLRESHENIEAWYEYGKQIDAGRAPGNPITLVEAFGLKEICDALIHDRIRQRRRREKSAG